MATGNSSELEVGNVNNSLIVEEAGNHEFEGSFEDIDLDNLNENYGGAQGRTETTPKYNKNRLGMLHEVRLGEPSLG